MRHPLSISAAAVITMMVVSAGVSLQPASAADSGHGVHAGRVVLAQNNGSARPNTFALLQAIQRLQDQVRSLRGEIDRLKYEQKQNEQGQRDLYKNLDKRLTRLENGGAGATSGGAGSNDTGSGGQADSQPGGDGGSSTGGGYGSQGGGYGAPSGGESNASGAGNAQVQSQYMAAFDKLKGGDYDAAISGLQAFVDEHPDSSYTDNAWYWLGEANYVQRNYDDALKAFQTLVNRFGNSGKVPGALFKIGVIQADQGQTDNAKSTLNRVVSQYPDDPAADMARKRLQSM